MDIQYFDHPIRTKDIYNVLKVRFFVAFERPSQLLNSSTLDTREKSSVAKAEGEKKAIQKRSVVSYFSYSIVKMLF